MKHLTCIFTLLLIISSPCSARLKTHVSFEATVSRIEPWGMAKLACGIYANYRLAEYKVTAVYDGKLTKGQVVMVKHLACNYNELDDLKVGDKVLVVAEVDEQRDKTIWNNGIEKQGEPVKVKYRALSVGKLVYPTADSPR